jgi:hypothetical protein
VNVKGITPGAFTDAARPGSFMVDIWLSSWLFRSFCGVPR